ncbi:MAG TPA: hypothetical protein DCQ12_05150, partial [Candidatus Cloacimonas sp.]|nr:hypothetical protein [Candidatus Cloacimonas sp.]
IDVLEGGFVFAKPEPRSNISPGAVLTGVGMPQGTPTNLVGIQRGFICLFIHLKSIGITAASVCGSVRRRLESLHDGNRKKLREKASCPSFLCFPVIVAASKG